MRFSLLDARVEPIPDLFLPDGTMRLVSSAHLDRYSTGALRMWCHRYARYGVVTSELVSWLLHEIAGRPAIEIGAGAGDLAFHLGIPATDSRLHDRPEIAEYYRALQQAPIRYGTFVEKFDGLEAVKHYTPQVVIGNWVTQWIDPTKPPPAAGGNVHGVREDAILDLGVTYIKIGNEDTHGADFIMRRTHETHRFPWLRSKAADPSKNRIWVWRAKGI